MASTNIRLSEEDFRCSICMDVYTDPVSTPCGHNYCRACIARCWDTDNVYKCPLCGQIFDGRPDVCVNYFVSEAVQRFRSRKLKVEEYEAKTEAEIRQMIQERRVKIWEVKRSVEHSRKYTAAVKTHRLQLFSALIGRIEKSRNELINVIEEEQKTTEKQAEGFVEDLQGEIVQLGKRISEVNQLSHTEDHLHYSKASDSGWIPSKDWTKVKAHQSSHVGTLRTALSRLEKTLSQEMEKGLCDAKLRSVQQYEVEVTLDPETAHPKLTLSEDGKQVSNGGTGSFSNVPDSTKRFERRCGVLGKQSFSSGRFYYEVQVGGKTSWSLGVARESIDRKGPIIRTPNNGFWTIGLKKGIGYCAAANSPVLLPVKEELQKVGVFVDYEEALVSFYDVETRGHLYSFTGCLFTEKLIPYFTPGNGNGRNSAPLIISPVNMDATLRENVGNMSPPPSKRRRICLLQ